MTLTIRCADFNSDCPAEFTAPDEQELLEHVELHTRSAHSQMEWTPELVEVVKTRVRDA
jgi:predicted small metal-binding protein